MKNELPESILNMQVGDFILGCEHGDPEVKYWAGKPFELNMPTPQKANEQPEESKDNESSSDYKDAINSG